MSRKSTSRKNPGNTRDEKKEAIFKELCLILAEAGHTVRREQLKQGHGWKVVSGACTAHEQPMVFVDRRMTQDDQIAFLGARIASLNLNLSAEHQNKLPPSVVELINSRKVEAAPEVR